MADAEANYGRKLVLSHVDLRPTQTAALRPETGETEAYALDRAREASSGWTIETGLTGLRRTEPRYTRPASEERVVKRRRRNAAKRLGETLGKLGKRFSALRAERDEVATSLRSVLREAQAMLADLGGAVGTANSPRRKPARKRKRRLSPEGRANIIAAAKKRWARERRKKAKGS